MIGNGNERSGEDALLAELADALGRLDQWPVPEPPDPAAMRQWVAGRRRRRLWRDLVLFWLVALAAVAAGLAGLRRFPDAYLVLQAALFGGFLFAALARTLRTEGRVRR